MPKEEIIVGLDIGSSAVRVLVGQFSANDEKPHIVGVGIAPSSGIRRGVIVDVEEAVGSISTALEKAERVTGFPIESVYVSLGGIADVGVPVTGAFADDGLVGEAEDQGVILFEVGDLHAGSSGDQ